MRGIIRLYMIALLTLAFGLVAVLVWGGRPAYSAVHPPALHSAPADPAATVLSYASQGRAGDELVEVRPGVWAKSSNIYGLSIDGATYYYQVSPHASFDPLSQGRVGAGEVRVVQIFEESGFDVVVYVIAGPLANAQHL